MVSKTAEELEQWKAIEQVLLGSILLNSECLDKIDGITESSFQSRQHRMLFSALVHLRESKTPIEAVVVAEYLASKSQLADIGGILYLEKLMSVVTNTESMDFYVGKLKESERKQHALLKIDVAREAIKSGDMSEANRAITEIHELTEYTTKQRFEFLSAEGLSGGDFKIRWLINGLIAADQLCLMAAQKKCLKTNISIDLAFCLATGTPFLGKFTVPNAVQVAMISGELGKATTQETFRRIALSHGWSPRQVKNLHFCFDIPSLDNAEDLLQLKNVVKTLGIKVLFIDPIYLCLNLGEASKNLFSVGEKLLELVKLGDETGCTLVLIHHTRKSNGFNAHVEPELEEIYGSGFQEIARQWILLGRREAYKPDMAGHHKLFFVGGGSVGHSQSWALDINEGSLDNKGGRVWETNLFPIQQARAEKQTEKEQRDQEKKEALAEQDIQKVIAELESIAKPEVVSNVRDAITLSTARTKTALAALVKSGQVICEQLKAGNGKQAKHYSIAPVSPGRTGINKGVPVSRSSEGQDRDGVLCSSTRTGTAPIPESIPDDGEDSTLFYPGDLNDAFPTDSQGYYF